MLLKPSDSLNRSFFEIKRGGLQPSASGGFIRRVRFSNPCGAAKKVYYPKPQRTVGNNRNLRGRGAVTHARTDTHSDHLTDLTGNRDGAL